MSKVSQKTKKKVRTRANGICEYCLSQDKYSPTSFSVEHIIPGVNKGTDNLDNLALACQGCNNHKFTRIEFIDPINDKKVKLFHPRKQIWAEHFQWNEDYSKIIGKTATGRATIECLRMNRENLLTLRKALFVAGVHPPEIVKYDPTL